MHPWNYQQDIDTGSATEGQIEWTDFILLTKDLSNQTSASSSNTLISCL